MIILVLYAGHFCCAHPIEGSNLCNVEVFVRVKEKNATGTAWHLGQEFTVDEFSSILTVMRF